MNADKMVSIRFICAESASYPCLMLQSSILNQVVSVGGSVPADGRFSGFDDGRPTLPLFVDDLLAALL